MISSLVKFGCYREELERQRAHERYMKLQEQGKTEQARKDLGKLLKQSSLRISLVSWSKCIIYSFTEKV